MNETMTPSSSLRSAQPPEGATKLLGRPGEFRDAAKPRRKLRLYSKLDARFDDSDEDPRASLVNLVDVMLVFACGLLAAISAGAKTSAPLPQNVEKGREISRPAVEGKAGGAGYDRVGDVFRDPKSGKLILIEPQGKLAKP